jgi:FAD/FMN-containing dehydrogenase
MQVTHEQRVRGISDRLLERPAGARIRVRKATPRHSVRSQAYKAGLHPVDVSALDQILVVDPSRQVAVVEGQVTMGALVRATLAHGLIPAVVPEFRQFTVSGLISGEGVQSSSHRYGGFAQTVSSIEVLLADGRTLTTSADHHSEVFSALPESLGTLGIVTAATIRLVPARPFVKCRYRRFDSLPAYLDAFSAALGQNDFHEGFVFGPRCYVLVTGQFVDQPGALEVFDPDEAGGEYFYQHVLARASAAADSETAIATEKYLFRMERGLWWLVECHAGFPLLTSTAWGRKRLDQGASATYDKAGFASVDLSTEERDRCLVHQDMRVTLEGLRAGLEWVQSRLAVYPLWNCAVRLPEEQRRRLGTSYVVGIGIYGEPAVAGYRNVRDLRELQRSVPAPSLRGVSYLTWDEVRATNPKRFDRYERVRTLVDADLAFLHLKDKVVWVDPASADPGPIKWWRAYRTFGPRWYLNPFVYVLLGMAYASKAIWRKPGIAR